eukprot:TRINITY_DN101858_c0_g1_i1.p1 TRINITY_DN101858_c0_g1~~TRINITY_DN101858_c0_g1_i1.p1  ORF type:complete len:689 (+),score=220.17 TRINITY_DN101858_c0_g1_i1:119-2185(+)
MSVGIQKQIKDNSTDVREYISDLVKWSDEEEKREKRRILAKNAKAGIATPAAASAPASKAPGSSSATSSKAKVAEKTSDSTSDGRSEEAIRRDKTPMPQYYHDWDSYDAEAEEEKLEEETREQILAERAAKQAEKDRILDDLAINGEGERSRTTKAKPRVKIAVRTSGRRASPVDLATPKKEEANRYLAEGRYREAMAVYSQGLDLLEKYEPNAFDVAEKKAKEGAEELGPQTKAEKDDSCGQDPEALNLKTALFANRALAMLKMEEWRECIEDCTDALRFDPNHHKATLRRGFALAKMKRWGPAHRDLQKAIASDPSDKKAVAELGMAKRMLEAQVKETRTSAMAVMCDPTRNTSMPTRRLTVKVKRSSGGDDVDGFVPSKPDIPATASNYSPASEKLADDRSGSSQPASEAAPRERQPYVPRAVRMRGRQAPPPSAEAATGTSSGSSAYPAGSAIGSTANGRAPAAQAMNYYKFEAQWVSLGRQGGAAARIPLLRKVGAKAIATLFRESLDAELLANIIQVLLAALEAEDGDLGDLSSASTEDAGHFAASVMDALVRTQRFDLSIGGLSRSERGSCGEVIDRLAAQRCCDEETLARLREAFDPPKRSFKTAVDDDEDHAAVAASSSRGDPGAIGDEEFDPDDMPEPANTKASSDRRDDLLHAEYVNTASAGNGAGNGAYISLDDCD